VDDLIAGIWRLALSPEHDPVNLGNPGEFTLLELAAQVIEATGSESTIVFESLPENDPVQRKPDITRARNLLGWEPTVALAEGLRLLLERSARHELIGRTS
jgi:dTDP-glucose 4,6-dehydratase